MSNNNSNLQIINKIFISDFEIGDKHKNYDNCLIPNNIDKGCKRVYHKTATEFTEFIAKQNILALVVITLLLGIGAGFASGCGSLGSIGCTVVFKELKEPLPISNDKSANKDQKPDSRKTAATESKHNTPSNMVTDASFAPEDVPSNEATNNKITKTIIAGEPFNTKIFRTFIIGMAFFLAFARWQAGNRHSAMSELFERKKEVNLLLLKTPEIHDLVSGATTFTNGENEEDEEDKPQTTKFSVEKCVNRIEAFLKDSPQGQKKYSFTEKMFVYIELDNLEFAHMKYNAGLLDREQMHRACEIFESRCKNGAFRYLAANQGFAYYTDSFHKLVAHLLLLGYAKTNGKTI